MATRFWILTSLIFLTNIVLIFHTVPMFYFYRFFINWHFYFIPRSFTPYLSVFSRKTEKYGPEKLQIRTLFTQYQWLLLEIVFNPFLGSVLILYSLEASQNFLFSSVFRRCKIGILARNELIVALYISSVLRQIGKSQNGCF